MTEDLLPLNVEALVMLRYSVFCPPGTAAWLFDKVKY